MFASNDTEELRGSGATNTSFGSNTFVLLGSQVESITTAYGVGAAGGTAVFGNAINMPTFS